MLDFGFWIQRFQVQIPAWGKVKKSEDSFFCVVPLDKALYSHCLSPPSCSNGYLASAGEANHYQLHYNISVAVVQVGLRVPTPLVPLCSWYPLVRTGLATGGLSARAHRPGVAHRILACPGCVTTKWQLSICLLPLCVCVCVCVCAGRTPGQT